MLPLFIVAAIGGGSVVVTLSGNTVGAIDGSAPYDSFSSFRFDSDGNVYEASAINGGGLSYSQIDTVTDWVRPANAGGADFEVRVTSVDHNAGATPGAAWSTSPGADGSWFALSTDRIWTINETAVGTYSTTATVEIRDTASLTLLATGAYIWNIANNV